MNARILQRARTGACALLVLLSAAACGGGTTEPSKPRGIPIAIRMSIRSDDTSRGEEPIGFGFAASRIVLRSKP